MSQVTNVCKCDRCNSLYETGGKTPTLAIKYTANTVTKNIDLCPKCTEVMLDMLACKSKKVSEIVEEHDE